MTTKTTEMSLTRVLSELKTLTARIVSLAQTTSYVAVQRGTDANAMLLTQTGNTISAVASPKPSEVAAAMVTEYQSLNDLIKRKQKLKAALVKANATTFVTIGTEEMTIADAIERKASVPVQQTVIDMMKRQFNGISGFIEKEMRDVNSKIETQQSQIKAGDKEVSAELLESTRKSIETRCMPVLIDPLNIVEEVKKREEALAAFTTNVDFALSEINVKTTVHIPD